LRSLKFRSGRGYPARKRGQECRVRLGDWLTAEKVQVLWQAPDPTRVKGKRDRALLALLLACGLRRHEAVKLRVADIEQREEHWAIVDLIGKGHHVKTVPIPTWVWSVLNEWLSAAGIRDGRIFRRVSRTGRIVGPGITAKAVWHVVKQAARAAGISKLAPHDLRRSCARLCQTAGVELEQIQLLLGMYQFKPRNDTSVLSNAFALP